MMQLGWLLCMRCHTCNRCCVIICVCFMLSMAVISHAGNLLIGYQCNHAANFSTGSAIEGNLKDLLNNLVVGLSANSFYNTSAVGQGPNRVYGLIQCRGDTSADLCMDCALSARTDIQSNCGRFLGAKLWSGLCYLRWENNNFIGNLDFSSGKFIANSNNISHPPPFMKVVQELFNSLSTEVMRNSHQRYASGFTNYCPALSIYGLAQCWMDISMNDCKSCLENTLNDLYAEYYGNIGAGRYTASCYAGYDVYHFYAATPSVPSPITLNSLSPSNDIPAGTSVSSLREVSGISGNKFAVILGATCGSLILLLLLSFSGCFVTYRKLVHADKSLHHGRAEKLVGGFLDEDQLVMFSMEELKTATNNFDELLKLGEGGFGAVYKGILPSGEIIAVKKLFNHSVLIKEEEFLNEVKVLAKIQHRNLVTLLGCCTDDGNRMIVFEYLPGLSLDKHLFDASKAIHLDWKIRHRIILGIAKGLVYLHEDGKLKIIHRDIKANNILLDESYNPRIADFGIARLFKQYESHVQTRVAGTCGYLAPEYAVKGQLSTKADVYSFGVLLLEIITGKQMRYFDPPDLQSLLEWTWRFYQERNISETIDQAIKETCILEQVERFSQIALLCTQADSSMRPPMSAIMLMLSSAFVPLPTPIRPAYVNSLSIISPTNEGSCIQGCTSNDSQIYSNSLIKGC